MQPLVPQRSQENVASSATSDEDDRALVARFLLRRREADFRRLYRRHTPAMISLARHAARGGGPSAEDVVQEAWVRAVRALPSFEWRSSLRSWLGGIVVNVVREHRRAAAREVTAMDEESQAIDWTDPIVRIAMADVLRDLPSGFRSVLTLHDLGGFTHEEIGALLGIDPGTSKSQLSRARRSVRDRLGRDFDWKG